MAIIAAIAASFAVAYRPAVEGDEEDDPVACGGGFALFVWPHPVASSDVEISQNTPSHFRERIFGADSNSSG